MKSQRTIFIKFSRQTNFQAEKNKPWYGKEIPCSVLFLLSVPRHGNTKNWFPHLPLLGQATGNHSPQVYPALAGPLALQSHREGQEFQKVLVFRNSHEFKTPGQKHLYPLPLVSSLRKFLGFSCAATGYRTAICSALKF